MGTELYGSGTRPQVGDTRRMQLLKDVRCAKAQLRSTQPNFIGSGITTKTGDTRLMLLAKRLGALQNSLGSPNSKWNPHPKDTVRTLLLKLDAAQAGL